MKRKGEGEAACLHASNLLMVEEKQTISHYLSLAAAVCHCILLVPEQLTVQLCFQDSLTPVQEHDSISRQSLNQEDGINKHSLITIKADTKLQTVRGET